MLEMERPAPRRVYRLLLACLNSPEVASGIVTPGLLCVHVGSPSTFVPAFGTRVGRLGYAEGDTLLFELISLLIALGNANGDCS